MKTLLLLIALSWVAMAQNLVGLPDAKVDLAGTLEAPVIVNHAHTPIIACVFKRYLSGLNPGMLGEAPTLILVKSLARNPLESAGIPPGGEYTYITSTTPVNSVIKLELDGVLFADGRYVGPDETKIWARGWIQAQINGLRNSGLKFSMPGSDLGIADDMASVRTIKHQGKNIAEKMEESLEYRAASEISAIRHISGDDEARKAAVRFSALPNLWKEN